ncbi:PepSY domain-containing protein [Stutzerimonas urumqiensis]|uniref:PepSY-associated TM helix domain-containing protein n=1 Tax=Stutzerimonas urumqiensis TaxID=638269 RepID=UPI003BACA909
MSLRQSMAGLHTWGGLLPSWLLYVIIFTGTVACFDKELERWMRPALHDDSSTQLTAEGARNWVMANADKDLHAIWMRGPNEREPFWAVHWMTNAGEQGKAMLDPATGAPLAETLGGQFFFTLHYNLHADTLGMYVVGLAGMFMLVALVSGVIIHRRIFKDFFTLRPRANGQRAWLDAHNLFGVVGFPFHLLLAYTGVVVFVASYMPAGGQVAYGNDQEAYFTEVTGSYHREEVGRPAPPAVSLDGLLRDAQARWSGAQPGWIVIEHPLDASAVVAVRRADASRIGDLGGTLSYDAGTGELLHVQEQPPFYRAYSWMVGLHMAQFGGSLVRALYLMLGLAGCAMVVAGTRVWLRKREARAVPGVALVRALDGAVYVGLPVASLALLWANRLLPAELPWRASGEGWTFVIAWLAVALWSALARHHWRLALRSQLVLIGLLALGLPLLSLLAAPNGHLLAAVPRGDWGLVGVDLALLAIGLIALIQAFRLSPDPVAQPARRAPGRFEEAL